MLLMVFNKEKCLDRFEKIFFNWKKGVRSSKYPDIKAALLLLLQDIRAANFPVKGHIRWRPGYAGWVWRFQWLKWLAQSFSQVQLGLSTGKDVPLTVWQRTAGVTPTRRATDGLHMPRQFPEASCFANMLLCCTYAVTGEVCTSTTQHKDRTTILRGSNATGNAKLPLLITGKAQRAMYFQNARLP